jgi:Ca2+-binding RTX toxin-like protein
MGALAIPAAAAVPKCNGKAATNPGSLLGTPNADVIIGTPADDVINGLGGNDTICGLGGHDDITGGDDDDWIDGGDGDDKIDFTDDAGNDVIKGGNGADILGGDDSPGDDTYDGGKDYDRIFDLAGANVGHGGPGSDNVSVTGQAYGDDGNDYFVDAKETSPEAGDAFASGGSGNDGEGGCGISAVRVQGGTADGGSGNDVICLFGDGDTGIGGSGSDRVDGTIGNNQFLDCGAAYDSYLAGSSDTVRRCEQLVGD